MPLRSCILVLALLAPYKQQTGGEANRGTISLNVADDGEDDQASISAVSDALTKAGFLVLPGGGSRYLATVTISHERHGSVTTKTAVAGPETNVGQWGARIRVTLPSQKRELHDLIVTRMTITLVSRYGYPTHWTGTVFTAQVEGDSANTPDAVGRRLATALLSRFPATLEGPLSVP